MKKILLCSMGLVLFTSACKKDSVPASEQTIDPKIAVIEAQVAKALSEADQLLLEAQTAADDRANVVLPAGSTSGDLAAAIAAAGPNGKVTVESGVHYESGTVEINIPVTIVGLPGATFHWSGLEPADPDALQLDPAIYVLNTNDVTIKKLIFQPSSGSLRTCILFENVSNAKVLNNQIYAFQAAVTGVGVDNAKISGNYIEGPGYGIGIGIVSGESMLIADNEVFAFSFSIFPSGSNSDVVRNTTYQAFFGIMLCQLDLEMPNGTNIEAPVATNNFLFAKNESYNNAWGILVIDGSFDNTLFKNNAHDNSLYDIELCTETQRFGPPGLPTSSNSTVISNGNLNHVVIKDCAPGSVIVGGTLVDTNADPCN